MKPIIFEEHSSVLPEWWQRKEKGKTLIYLDAHLDLQYVNQQRMALIESCTQLKQVKCLEKPHHLLPDEGYVYSLENFLYPAFRLGIINRLIWVSPPHVKTDHSQNVLDHVQQMDGVSNDELSCFRKHASGYYEGKLLGLDIVICAYEQLEKIALPEDSLIDIDTDYFVSLPSDESWIDPQRVFKEIERLRLKTGYITISRSVSSGFMPLKYRFYADYLEALFQDDKQNIEHYTQLYQLESRLRAGETQAVADGCHQQLERHPHCAATYFLLSQVPGDAEAAEKYQYQAQNLCSAYKQDLLCLTSEILNRHLAIDQRTVIGFESALDGMDAGLEQQSFVHIALGLIYCAAGQVQHAYRHYRSYGSQTGCHPELALEIGKLLLQNGQSDDAFTLLETALADDKTKTSAHIFLSHCQKTRGAFAEAEQHLLCAHRLAPAWGDVLIMLSDIQRRLGKTQAAQEMVGQFQKQQTKLAALAKRLDNCP